MVHSRDALIPTEGPLLPCPFCGGEANRSVENKDERSGYERVAHIACESCGGRVSVASKTDKNGWNNESADRTDARAAALWNRRVPPTPTPSQVQDGYEAVGGVKPNG